MPTNKPLFTILVAQSLWTIPTSTCAVSLRFALYQSITFLPSALYTTDPRFVSPLPVFSSLLLFTLATYPFALLAVLSQLCGLLSPVLSSY